MAASGWGVFNVIDQFACDLLLEAHHIRMENYRVYDWSFFALGLVLIAAGFLFVRGSPGRDALARR